MVVLDVQCRANGCSKVSGFGWRGVLCGGGGVGAGVRAGLGRVCG